MIGAAGRAARRGALPSALRIAVFSYSRFSDRRISIYGQGHEAPTSPCRIGFVEISRRLRGQVAGGRAGPERSQRATGESGMCMSTLNQSAVAPVLPMVPLAEVDDVGLVPHDVRRGVPMLCDGRARRPFPGSAQTTTAVHERTADS
ncbi:MAG TPA: hypothetical protein VH372_21135 [Actinospica sp.]|nr:hypothetical protein [Actinospica sp.]